MRQALRDALHLDRSQLAVNAAARNTVGVVLPLIIGASTGHPIAGITVAIGAQNVSLADKPGPYRLRLVRMLVVAAVAAIGAGLGIVVGRLDVLAVALTLVWALGAGLLVALGPTATQVGITSTILMLVLAGRSQYTDITGLTAATYAAAQILGGGIVQALLAVSAWPLRRYRPERVALAKAYHELADAATERPGTDTGPPLTSTLDAVHRTILGLGRDRSAKMVSFRTLLAEAERIRIELLALNAHAERLADLGANSAHGRVVDVLDAASAVLRNVGEALSSADPPVNAALAARRLSAAIESLSTLAEQSADSAFNEHVTVKAAAARAEALDDQVRNAVGTASTWRYEDDAPSGRHVPTALPVSLRMDNPVQVLRANLTPTSSAFRHAVRLAFCLAGSDALVRATDLPRGYWLPLMILITLQPGFSATVSRGLLRIGGTILGLGLVTALLTVLPDSHWLDVVLVAVFFFGFRAFFLASFGLSVAFLTALVVILLSTIGVDPQETAVERGLYTAAGGLVALGVYLAWPTWERSRVQTRLADLLTAYRDYLALVTAPDVTSNQLASARSAARVARTNAEDSLERLQSDPDRSRAASLLRLTEEVYASSIAFIHPAIRLEVARQDASALPDSPALAAFSTQACETLGTMAEAVRTGTRPDELPALRPAAEEVRHDLTTGRLAADDISAALIESTDRIARALDELAKTLTEEQQEPAT